MMDDITVRRKHLEKLDAFVHSLYLETQTFKQYGMDLPDLEVLYLHIHDLITDMLSVTSSTDFMKKMEELHKGIVGIMIVVGAGNPEQIVKEMSEAHEGMSDMTVEDFLNNMKVKEKPEKPKQEDIEEDTDEDKQARADSLAKDLGIKTRDSKIDDFLDRWK